MKARELLDKMYKNNTLHTKIKSLKKRNDILKAFNCCSSCGQTLNSQLTRYLANNRIQETLSCAQCDPVGKSRFYTLN